MRVLFYFQLLRALLGALAAHGEGLDLLQRYPAKSTAGDNNPDHARPWEFTDGDIFRVTQFHLVVDKNLQLEVGPADLGIGHCADGAVWAVLIPRAEGILTRQITNHESIAHVWLRFHPKEINRLFPAETVFNDEASNLVWQMRAIAGSKMYSSWQAGGRAMIPEPKDLTVDVDTKTGLRRFFIVDTEARTAQYVAAFENNPVRLAPALTSEQAEAAFDQLWEAFDQKYAMFVLRPEVDWEKLREEYRPKALAGKSTYEFAAVCADMLKNLRDLHVWLTVAGANVPVFNRPRFANANPQAYRTILGGLNHTGGVAWAVTTNHIGLITILAWDDAKIPGECGEALENMRDTRGLIVDVRLNGGGSEPLAEQFASRFLEKEFVYAYSRFRNGPGHTNLTEKSERIIGPRGPWRYDRPVVLLIGQKCMSSCESFVGMMTGDPQVTTMGDHTCGSSGNPEILHLPLEMTVSVPQWIDYLPDGTPLDERGFQPQIPFRAALGAFEGDRDDLLSAALARLSQVPLPDKPIEGPVYEPSTMELPDHSRAAHEEARDMSRPRVISVTPANDATGVSPVTELRLRFDRPMDPLSLKLDWESGGFLENEFPEYDVQRFEFRIRVHLAPGALQQIVVNRPSTGDEKLSESRKYNPRDGFLSEDHHLAGIFVWHFRTEGLPASSRAPPPRVSGISPAPGSHVPFRILLQIQFDQAMAPPVEALPRLVSRSAAPKNVKMIAKVQYEATNHAFWLPLMLPTNETVEFTLTGFQSATGVPADPIVIRYEVSNQELTRTEQERKDADAKDPDLLNLLKGLKEECARLTSIAEHVQYVTAMLDPKSGLFYQLRSEGAVFKWQNTGPFYADVSDMMSSCDDFRIGSDGERCWWQQRSAFSTNFVVCPKTDIRELNISICDPFDLTDRSPATAAAELNLKYLGNSAGPLVEAWQVDTIDGITPLGSLLQWKIDRENHRPAEIIQYFPEFVSRSRLLYDEVNKPLPATDFALPQFQGLTPIPPGSLNQDYTNRFINLRDGSDGHMSVRWGKRGPKGTSSSGLN